MSLKVVKRRRLADTETPVSVYDKLCRDQEDSFLLESVETHESAGRYSIIAFDPVWRLELRHSKAEATVNSEKKTYPAEQFFDLIKQALRTLTLQTSPELPAVGSLMGYVGFDAVRLIEDIGAFPESDKPAARLVFPSRFVVFDNRLRLMHLIGIGLDDAEASARVDDMEKALGKQGVMRLKKGILSVVEPDRDRYVNAVIKAKEYIRNGDIFQVVLADRFQGETDVDPFNAYRMLRIGSPSPYMFFLNFGDFKIAGASPETMVKAAGGRIRLKPIAGTRGRSEDPERDKALEEELMASEKERAEHVMLVDLARNDAGRVAVGGSVSVSPYMTVERFSHVMHIVSQVQGDLRPDVDAVDAFVAGFPAGTVSGAPKVRAMQIIDELEYAPRGPYSGAVGYFGPGVETDTCIGIRMIVFEKGKFTIPVGAGIVADSDPEFEYREIGFKAAQSIAALKAAAEGTL